MPGLEDWLNCPLDIIQGLFAQHGKDYSPKVTDYFNKKLEDQKAMSWIPSLNNTPLHNLRPNTVVKFRCMVQDMFDPEFYLGAYETIDTKTGQKSMKSGKYKDIAQCLPHQEINLDSSSNVTLDRQTLYCVPLPGEAEWVREIQSQARVTPSTSHNPVRCKRGLDEDADAGPSAVGERVNGGGMEAAMETESGGGDDGAKRTRTEVEAGTSISSQPDLNFPLPDENGPASLVKIYENEQFKVNEAVEFVGVLSIDPALATFREEHGENDMLNPSMDGIEEHNAHCPPPSLVPRLHVLKTYRLQHNNPLLPMNINDERHAQFLTQALVEVSSIRSHVVSVFEQALFGDTLAAEYLLMHLVSSVYARRDVIALGKFCLNLSGCPRGSEYPKHLYKLIQELTTKSFFLPMSLSNMNNIKFTPKKDYTANRLTSGVLQLCDRTHLVLDETALEPGQLDANGVRNITALGNVINWQKVEYDFNFHRQDFMSNILVLIISEGKSILPSDCLMPIIPKTSTDNMAETFAGIHSFLTPALLTKLRTYFGLVQLLEYTFSEDIQKIVEEDFVSMRRDDPSSMTVDNFHALLVMARLMTLSYGKAQMTRDIWNRAKAMETERKQRLPAPSSNR